MARARNIKPGFFKNADLVELPMEARLLFVGLWTLADRAGRLEDRPKQIKMELFPADPVDIEACLVGLQQWGFVDRYVVDGKRVLQVVNFSKHQNPHRDERVSTLPARDGTMDEAPKKHGANTVRPPDEHDGGTVQIGLNPDPLIPDPPNPDVLNPDPGQPDEEINVADDAPSDPAEEAALRARREQVAAVFETWRQVMGHSKAKLDDKRKRIISARLKDGYSVDDLKAAIRGCSKSPYHMGHNDQGTRYDGLDLILRDGSKVDRFISFDRNPPRPQGKQGLIEANNRRAGDEFLNGPDWLDDGNTIDAEASHEG